jgi:NADP-dependent 3-hydroxy acid dehydrogenase YdfG
VRVGVVTPGMFETEGLTLEGIEFDGDTPDHDFPLFVPGTGPQPPEPLAEAIAFMLALPEGVAVHELVLRPTGQLYP